MYHPLLPPKPDPAFGPDANIGPWSKGRRKRTVLIDPVNEREVLREQSKSVLNGNDPTYSGALNLTLEKARTILNQIALELDLQEWSADTCDAIADILRQTGRKVRDKR